MASLTNRSARDALAAVEGQDDSDEETPLLSDEETTTLRGDSPGRKAGKAQAAYGAPTPIPWGQLWIILFLQLAEPLTSQVINPFAPQLVRDIGITGGDETKVGYYVGLLHSLFFGTQALTVLHWSRLSDHIGRKPVILTGLFGLAASMYCFGMSTTFVGLVMSRCLNGALNGNIGVIKSMMAEITDTSNIAQAYAYMPLAWSTGGTLGPLIGGVLSHPADRFPNVFGNSEFLKKYPYFLPCAVPATFSVLAWVITYIFLKETVSSSFSIKRLFIRRRPSTASVKMQTVPSPVIPGHTPPDDQPYPLSRLLTRPVLIAAGNYATLSLVDIGLRSFQPLFFSTPIDYGGLGLDASTIGTILSLYGIINGIFQIFFFPKIHTRWGTKLVFIAGITSMPPIFLMFPIINAFARLSGMSMLVWGLVSAQVILSIMSSLSYGCVFIYIQAASPNRASLGATNGLAQMAVSIMRTIGPSAVNSMFSLSMKEKNFIIVYGVLQSLGVVAILFSLFLPRQVWKNWS